MDLMRELIEAVKVSRKTAHAVYHRDYERTKKKPYRKYDAQHRASEDEEYSDNIQPEQLVCVYFDGHGFEPKRVAGPFSREEAAQWLEDNEIDRNDEDYFVDSAELVNEERGYAREKPRTAPRNWDVEHDKRRQKQLDASDEDTSSWPGSFSVYDRTTKKCVGDKVDSREKAQAYIDAQPNPENFTIHGAKVKPQVREGAFDFMKGAAQHIGGQIKQSVSNVVQAGKQQSAVGDITSKLTQLAKVLQQYDQLSGQPQQAPQTGQPEVMQAKPAVNPARSRAPSQPIPAPSASTPAAFRTTTKPRAKMGQHGMEYQFSSYLYDQNDGLLSEGVWDFMKGAGKAVVNQAAQVGKQAIAAGHQSSQAADMQQVKTQYAQLSKEIAQLCSGFGQDWLSKLRGILKQMQLDPRTQARLLASVQRAAKQ